MNINYDIKFSLIFKLKHVSSVLLPHVMWLCVSTLNKLILMMKFGDSIGGMKKESSKE
jgi:hypothetical protein